ncbi:hypothetical protein C4565_07270 [Candidatus Parcubacteria bacterium]|nr:MAG: hypothetical protein C4565_07270 [Candidatus Parcubacteria bacterium]
MSVEDLAYVGIGVSIAVGGSFAFLDWRRRVSISNNHKKIICHHMNELEGIFARIMIDFNRLDEDEDGISERLNHYLIGKYRHIEYLIDNIKLNKIQCSKLSKDEESDIENTLKVSQWLLDEYCPQDIPEKYRVSLWRKYNPKLKENATILAHSVKHFAN